MLLIAQYKHLNVWYYVWRPHVDTTNTKDYVRHSPHCYTEKEVVMKDKTQLKGQKETSLNGSIDQADQI